MKMQPAYLVDNSSGYASHEQSLSNRDALLLDEPTSSLDYKAARKIEELLTKLKEKYSIIAVSHSLGQTRRIADKCVVIKDGKIGAIFNKQQIDESEKFNDLIEDVF